MAATTTRGAWTFRTERGLAIFECDVTMSAGLAEYTAATLRLPDEFDGSRPFTIIANSKSVTVDGSALPVDIYAGWNTDFDVVWDGTTTGVTVTDGAMMIDTAIADVKAASGAYSYDPRNTAAAAVAPYFIFNLDGASGLETSGVCHFVVIQGTPYPKG